MCSLSSLVLAHLCSCWGCWGELGDVLRDGHTKVRHHALDPPFFSTWSDFGAGYIYIVYLSQTGRSRFADHFLLFSSRTYPPSACPNCYQYRPPYILLPACILCTDFFLNLFWRVTRILVFPVGLLECYSKLTSRSQGGWLFFSGTSWRDTYHTQQRNPSIEGMLIMLNGGTLDRGGCLSRPSRKRACYKKVLN